MLAGGRRYDVSRQRDFHLERTGSAGSVIQRRTTGDIVIEPEGAPGGRERDSPGILEKRILVRGRARDVRNEASHGVRIAMSITIVLGAHGGGAKGRKSHDRGRGELPGDTVHREFLR